MEGLPDDLLKENFPFHLISETSLWRWGNLLCFNLFS